MKILRAFDRQIAPPSLKSVNAVSLRQGLKNWIARMGLQHPRGKSRLLALQRLA